jgi:CRISPR-associated endoribonuclease Cas6
VIAAVVLELDGDPETDFSPQDVRAAWLSLIAGQRPDLARALHDAPNPRPYTTGAGVYRQRRYLRLTLLRPEHYAECSPALYSAIGSTLRLGGRRFTVSEVLDGGHPAAGLTTPGLLARSAVAGEQRFGLDCLTPTLFKRNRRVVPLPEPRLVFHSLLEKWDAHTGMPTPEGFEAWVEEHVVVSAFKLRSRVAPSHRGVLVGFVGQVWFKCLQPSHPWLAVLARLVAFAPYAGLGYQTTLGFGQVRALRNRSGQGVLDGGV